MSAHKPPPFLSDPVCLQPEEGLDAGTPDIHDSGAVSSAAVAPAPAPAPAPSYVVVEEEVLAELWIPGTVLHLYRDRGSHRAALVPRTLPSLRRVQLQPGMFRDHFAGNVFAALQETAATGSYTGRASAPHPYTPPQQQQQHHHQERQPPWAPLDVTATCQCCNAPFIWHTTFQSHMQAQLEGHSCHGCGASVCDPCSSHRLPIPGTSVVTPRRICDRCFYGSSYLYSQTHTSAQSRR